MQEYYIVYEHASLWFFKSMELFSYQLPRIPSFHKYKGLYYSVFSTGITAAINSFVIFSLMNRET